MNSSLSINFSKESLSDKEPWLTIKQEVVPKSLQTTSIQDILNMYAMAISGLPATDYIPDRCPVSILDGTITVHLGVFFYPSSMDLEYSPVLSYGTFGEMQIVYVNHEFDLIIPQSDSVSLDFVPESDIEFTWETEAYDSFGQVIQKPNISLIGNTVKLSRSCFAVLRVKCTAISQYYPISISVAKATVVGNSSIRVGYNISNFSASIQATWKDNEGNVQSESLSLDIPDCVKNLLESCGNGNYSMRSLNLNDDQNNFYTVYYSSCTGEILRADKFKDPESEKK